MKHIDVKFNFVREKVQKKLIHITYVWKSEQLADILTKALPTLIFENIRDIILSVL